MDNYDDDDNDSYDLGVKRDFFYCLYTCFACCFFFFFFFPFFSVLPFEVDCFRYYCVKNITYSLRFICFEDLWPSTISTYPLTLERSFFDYLYPSVLVVKSQFWSWYHGNIVWAGGFAGLWTVFNHYRTCGWGAFRLFELLLTSNSTHVPFCAEHPGIG